MISNAYGVTCAFFAVLRLLFSLTILGQSVAILWSGRSSISRASPTESRFHLVTLSAFTLTAMNLASWPLIYLLWDSYVPEWPGIMCIYGVTQIGRGTYGAARFLPLLIRCLEFIKPAAVFLTGAWFTLYWINRSSTSEPLTRRVLISLVVVGVIGIADCA